MGKQVLSAWMVLSISFNPLMVYADNKSEADEKVVAISCQDEGQGIDLESDPTVQAETQLYRNVSSGVMIAGSGATVYFLLMKSADQRLLLQNHQSRKFLREFLRLREALATTQAEFSTIMRSIHAFVIEHNLSDYIQEMKVKGISDPKYFLDKGQVPESERTKFNNLNIDRINNAVEEHRLQREIGRMTETLRRRELVGFARLKNTRVEAHIAALEKRAVTIAERIGKAQPQRSMAGVVGAALWIGGAVVFTMADRLATHSDTAEEAVLATTLECLARHQERTEAPVNQEEQIDYNMLRYLHDPANPMPFFKQKE